MFNKENIKTTILSCFVALILGGCATGHKMPSNDKLDNNKENQAKLIKEWQQTHAAIQYVQTDNSFLISRKNDVPERIKKIKIRGLNIYANSTFFDLIGVLGIKDVQLIIKEDDSEGIKDKKLFLHNYNGTVGELFEIIENTYNYSFNYQQGNVVTLEKDTLYIATVPQNAKVVEFIKSHLAVIGAEEVTASEVGGFVLYKASRQEHEIITEYLNNFYKNFASVKLQLAVLTVNLNNARNTGFDWSQFGVELGNIESESVADLGSNLSDTKAKLGLTGTSVNIGLKNKNFNMSAVYNLLSTYGNTETTQSIFVETTSGEKLELRSGQEIPYTSGISSNTNGNTGGVNSGSQTEKEEVGLNIEATPYYDFSKNLVTLELTMDLKSIIGFVELNAGNGNGTIKQPQTQTQKFNSVLKIRPGEAVLVGGIQYDIVSDNRNNISLLDDYNTASKSTSVSRNAMFLLLRPTVSVFADFEKEIASESK